MIAAYLEAAQRHHQHGSHHLALAAALALLSSLAFAAATVAQQRAAAESSDVDARGGKFVMQLLRNPRWLASNLGTAVGYALQAAALGFGSLLLVQPILVTSLLFALPLSARLSHRHLPKIVWFWGLVLAVSLALFVVLGDPNRGSSHASRTGWLVLAAIGIPIIAGCLVFAHPRSGATRASLLAIAVGLLGGVLAVLTKAVVGSLGHGLLYTVTTGEFYGLLIVGGSGIYLQQLSFQAGALQASLPIITVLEPIVAASLGVALLHEDLRASGDRLPVLIVAVLAMLLATIALARGAAHEVRVPV
jgi:drug/metabolite transporter (DMT)-like permease